AVRADAEALQVPELGQRHLPVGHRIESELHALVAVDADSPHLDNRARPGRAHGDRRHGTGLLVEDLRHTQLTCQDALGHYSLSSMSIPAGRSSRSSWSIVFGVGPR